MTDKPREKWDGTPVPIERWGGDHWSTFAYIETRIVDHDGYLDMRQMREDGQAYPSRLKDAQLVGHDDMDCAMDAVEIGLLEPAGKMAGSTRITQRDGRGDIKALTHRFALTQKGKVVAAKLRAHKGNGGNWRDFEPGPVLGWMAAGRS